MNELEQNVTPAMMMMTTTTTTARYIAEHLEEGIKEERKLFCRNEMLNELKSEQ